MDAVVQTKSVENSASLGSIFRLSESGDLIRLDHDQVSEYDFISTDKKTKISTRVVLRFSGFFLENKAGVCWSWGLI